MDNSRDILDELIYEGIYRDGPVTTSKVAKWLGIFQARGNHLADSKFLEFTTEILGNDRDDGRKYKAVGTTNKNYFPFLDIEMYWSPEGNLQFRVHLKENQVLKYLRSTPERESSIEISQSRKYAHRCNKNQGIRVNENGRIVPSAC
jgi:hypothetical protein